MTCLRGRHVYTAHRYFESVCRWKASQQQAAQLHKNLQRESTQTSHTLIAANDKDADNLSSNFTNMKTIEWGGNSDQDSKFDHNYRVDEEKKGLLGNILVPKADVKEMESASHSSLLSYNSKLSAPSTNLANTVS